jgi:2-dehydropantoate 2-reductase
MRILIMGSGGIGGYYGARLHLAGHDVVFTARGAHLDAMQTRGLEVRERDGSAELLPVKAVRFPADAGGTFDLIIVAVKAYDLVEAGQAIVPVVGSETSIVPIQNGVDSVDVLREIVDVDRILVGTTMMNAAIVEPGVVELRSGTTSITIGEPFGPISERVSRIVGAFHDAGMADAIATDDPQRALWEKFMFLAPIASINSATGLPTYHVRSVPEGLEAIRAMQAEIRAVGLAEGVNLPDESAEMVDQIVLRLTDRHTVSMQRDFADGKRVELETLTGSVVRRGRAKGIPTPVFSTIYGILRAKALSFGGVS